jgi:tetrahydromethanopterin S-methyltransferase subunit E
MFQLHLLRVLWTWTAIGCLAGSILMGNAMLHQQRAARAAFFYVFGIALSIVCGVVLNWFFGLAPLFCIRDQTHARNAVSLALDFCSRQGGRLFGLSLGFLALRLVWAGSMFFLVLAPTRLGHNVAVGWVLLLMGLLTLIYFAGADALHLARLGAYTALAEIDAQPEPTPEPQPNSDPTPQPGATYLPPEDAPGIQPT